MHFSATGPVTSKYSCMINPRELGYAQSELQQLAYMIALFIGATNYRFFWIASDKYTICRAHANTNSVNNTVNHKHIKLWNYSVEIFRFPTVRTRYYQVYKSYPIGVPLREERLSTSTSPRGWQSANRGSRPVALKWVLTHLMQPELNNTNKVDDRFQTAVLFIWTLNFLS